MLVSGSGTNLQALLDDEVIAPHIAVVLSDRPGVAALDRAVSRGIDAVVLEPAGYPDRVTYTDAVRDDLLARSIDTVLLAGYMRVLGAGVLRGVPGPRAERAPGASPAFPGAHAVRDALAWGVKVTGVTVHLVDEEVDHGPIVLQEALPVPRRRRLGLARAAGPRGRAPPAARRRSGVAGGPPGRGRRKVRDPRGEQT